MIHARTAGLLGALLLSALLLVGCGGGGGEPSVSQGVHDVLQHELDDALAELRAEREAKTREAAARRTAQGEVTRLNTELATANTEVTRLEGELTTANAEVRQLEGERDTATAEVTRLTGRIGTAGDAASAAEGASLYAQLNHAKAEATRLTGELATATTNADDLTTRVTAANAKVTELTGRIGNPSDAASDAETASLHAQLNHAKARETSLTAELEGTKRALETSQGRLTTVAERLEEEEEARQQAQQETATVRTEAERRIEEAEEQADASLRAGAWLTAMDGMVGRSATVQHKPRMSLVFRPAGNYTTGTAAPAVPGGWRRASFTRVTGGGSETAYLYTNIGPRSGKHFWKVYGDGVAEGDDDWNLTLAKPSPFGTAGMTRSLYPDGNDDDTDPDDKEGRVSRGGTYNGYSGTFSCTGTSDSLCNIDADTTNALTFDGVWTFKASPTAPGTLTEDPEFLYFGIWASEPTSATAGHGFNWIAGGDPTNITLFTELTGTAEFNGGAVGRYVLRNQVGQGDRTGTFTATASFTADFDATPSNTIEGRITNFQEGGTALTDWSVYLGSNATTAAALEATGTTGGLVATARIGGVPATGEWAATLHGSDNPGHAEFGTGAGDVRCPVSGGCPSADLAGVAGWFDAFSDETTATNSDAAIAGAFAATPR